MHSESRRSKRHTEFIPVSVFVCQEGSDEPLAGPFPGIIIDICSYGACLLMSRIMQKNFHVYHSTRSNKSAFLRIKIDSHPDLEGGYLDARPVWLNTFQREDFRERMIGVEYLAAASQSRDIGALVEKL